MLGMAKKKRPDPIPAKESEPTPPKRYPSRENLRYVALPLDLYEALARYAEQHSTEDDKKSMSWANRVAVRDFLKRNGFWPPPADED